MCDDCPSSMCFRLFGREDAFFGSGYYMYEWEPIVFDLWMYPYCPLETLELLIIGVTCLSFLKE
jgi:hypothetical protein